jgi:hypothetical protein
MCEKLKELELLWTKLKWVITDRTPNMTGKKTGLICTIRRNTSEKYRILHGIHCIIHQHVVQGLGSGGFGCEFHSTSWTSSSSVCLFLSEIDAEYGDVFTIHMSDGLIVGQC